MKDTPYSERLHITVFGKMNSGKSSLFNALVGQPLSIVSDVSGTTADTVSKAVEIPGVGPCLLTDTAGFDDICTSLGRERVSKTRKASEKAEIGILLFTDADDVEQEWFSYLQKAGMQVIPVISRADLLDDSALASRIVAVEKICDRKPVVFSASDRRGVSAILDAVRLSVSGRSEEISITGDLVHSGDTVLLVMPQDKEAPKGRVYRSMLYCRFPGAESDFAGLSAGTHHYGFPGFQSCMEAQARGVQADIFFNSFRRIQG